MTRAVPQLAQKLDVGAPNRSPQVPQNAGAEAAAGAEVAAAP